MVVKNIDKSKVATQATVYSVLFAISASHMLNDMIQSVIASIYPMLKEDYMLTFSQVGLITLVFQLTASLLQPVVGHFTDKHPVPFSLSVGMLISLTGLISLAFAGHYYMILVSVALIGMGSSIFHPESSRVAQIAGGEQKGLAQSIFQVGGNFGTSIGPLLAAAIVVPYGQKYISTFGILALIAFLILLNIGKWYKKMLLTRDRKKLLVLSDSHFDKKTVRFSLIILLILMFSKFFYLSSMSNYYTFYMIDKFGVSIQQSQVHLFIFLAAVAAGTLIGGPIGDKYGRKLVIWVSILGVAPFTLLLPHMNFEWTIILSVIIGLILSSAFSAILVYATDLIPGKVGTIAGLFFGLSFGMGGIASAFWGSLADKTSIAYVFSLTAYLPLLGILTAFLPNIKNKAAAEKK